jgi:sugar lactone lactonase YvrE
MNRLLKALLGIASLIATAAIAHPGSGLAVDSQGNTYFVDTGAGVWQLQPDGKLNKLKGPAFHWLALDRTERLSKVDLPYFTEGGATMTHVEHNLIVASESPLSVDADGALYFSRVADGKLRIFRLDPTGSTTTFATISTNARGEALRWINGSAIGSDGTFYFTEDNGVWKIEPAKDPVLVSANLPKADCTAVPGVGLAFGLSLRGIDIDAKGNLFVAATACQAVLKIAPDKAVTILSRTTGAWAPTGVATFGSDVYVLEYLHTAGERRREWIPRVRKIAANGGDSIIATVER